MLRVLRIWFAAALVAACCCHPAPVDAQTRLQDLFGGDKGSPGLRPTPKEAPKEPPAAPAKPPPADAGQRASVPAPDDFENKCRNPGNRLSLNVVIEGCTALIRSGRWSGKGMAVAYFLRGRARTNNEDFDLAIADFTESIRIDETTAPAFAWRGFAYYRKSVGPPAGRSQDNRDDDRAIADYTEAIRLNPSDHVAYNNRGTMWNNKNDYDRALTDIDRAIQMNSQYAAAYFSRGMVWKNKGNKAKAVEDLTEAVRIDPSHQEAVSLLKQLKP